MDTNPQAEQEFNHFKETVKRALSLPPEEAAEVRRKVKEEYEAEQAEKRKQKQLAKK